jgi:hypothetical protein
MSKRFALVLGLMFCGCMSAQSVVPRLEKVKSIKLLESDRDFVIGLLSADSLEISAYSNSQTFYTADSVIRVTYSNGTCSGEYEDWNVPVLKVTEIEITPKDRIGINRTRIDYSKFRKERTDPQRKNIYVLYDKAAGIAVSVFNDKVDSIFLSPTSRSYSLLCNNKVVKEYYASKRWRRDPHCNKDLIIDYNSPADVTDLLLSHYEVTSATSGKIDVTATAVDPETDVLTYVYKISGGKIVGSAAKVVWDLTGVKPGTYSITAAVNDGCGLCGKFVTKTVVVKN